MKYTQIAIDGPAGAGKSTIAKLLAKSLKYTYIDTGSMYRGITLKAIRNGIDVDDESAFTFLKDTTFKFVNNHIHMDGEDISHLIREHKISNNVSVVASYKSVREKLVQIQNQMAQQDNVVMDGRDIGYNVLPNAQFKFFLTASIEERARRRYEDNIRRGIGTNLEKLVDEIKRRDHIDTTRKHSPLKPADDAVIIDTSDLSIEEVVNVLTTKIREEV